MQRLLWCCSVMQQDGFSWWTKAILKLLILLYVQKTHKTKDKSITDVAKKGNGKQKSIRGTLAIKA